MRKYILGIQFCLLFNLISAQIKYEKLTLTQAYKYQGQEKAAFTDIPQFSGLTFITDTLFTIDDKDNSHILKIRFAGNEFYCEHLDLYPSAPKAEFEAITTDGKNLYVINETSCKYYEYDLTGELQNYGSWRKDLDAVKLCKEDNAGIEGAAYISKKTFLLAAERQPRALVQIDGDGNVTKTPWESKIDTCTPPQREKEIKTEDNLFKCNEKDWHYSFSDVFIKDNRAYALDRFMESIYVIDYSKVPFSIESIWTFNGTLKKEDECSRCAGSAEGLALDEKYIYVILDNNYYSDTDSADTCKQQGRILFKFNLPAKKEIPATTEQPVQKETPAKTDKSTESEKPVK